MVQRQDVETYTLAQVIHALRAIQGHCNILEEGSTPLHDKLIRQNSDENLDNDLLNELTSSIPVKAIPYSFIELLILIWNSVNPQNQISQENDSVFIFYKKYKWLNKFLEDRELNDIFFIVGKRLCKTDWNIKGKTYKCLFFKHKNTQKFTVKRNNSEQEYFYKFGESNEDLYVSGYINSEVLNQKCSILQIPIKSSEIKSRKEINYLLISDNQKLWSSCYLNSLLKTLVYNDKFYQKIQTVKYPLFFGLSSIENFTQQECKELMMELIGRLSEFTEIDSLFAITNEQALNFKEKGEYRFLSIAPLPEKDEEKCFWEQIIYKVAPFIKFNRLSKEKPYAYFEKNEATAYYLAAIFTENEQKWIYCNSCNQWINISINPKNKEKIIFSEGAAYFYIKINKKDFEKDKVSKQLSLEWERRKYKQKKLPEIYKSTEKTKKIEIEKLKNIEIQQKIQNSEDIINNYQLERLNNQEITNNRKELMAEKDENGEKMQKDNRIQRKLQWKLITLKELIFENEILEKRCINYENKAELLEKENQTYKAQNEVLNQEKEIYKAQNEFLNQENQTYKAQNEVLNQEKETYKAQNEVLNQENQTYKTQLKSLTEEIKKLRENKILNYPLIFDRKKAGIPNIGNTCYLNSLLQVFASNNEFCEKIRPLTYELFSTLSSLLVSIRDPTTNTIWEFVMAFKSRFNDEFPWLGDLTQQDSKEVLLMLIGRLSDFTNIEPLFIISYKQILNCHDCNYKAKATETNTFITVPINKFSSIQEFITDIKKPKKFIGDGSQLYCEKCNKQQDMTVEYEEIIWPSTVTFYLSSKNGRIRINKELDIEGTIYRWYGLICHYGDSWSGHYLAYTWDTNNWTEYNDSKTANRCSRSIDVANGYLAFYARAGNPK